MPPLGEESGSSCLVSLEPPLHLSLRHLALYPVLVANHSRGCNYVLRAVSPSESRGWGWPWDSDKGTQAGVRVHLIACLARALASQRDGRPGAGQGPGAPCWASCQPWCSWERLGRPSTARRALGTAAFTTRTVSLVLITEPEIGPRIYDSGPDRSKAI